MSPRTALACLSDMKAAIEGIEHHLQAEPLETFERNMLVFRAVERELEIISEASRHVPESLKGKFPQVPWRSIADIGNVLRHAYQRVDPALLRAVIRDHLPGLRDTVDAMIRDLGRGVEEEGKP